jgi:hypothetical protein
MNRRAFLKLAAMATGALAAGLEFVAPGSKPATVFIAKSRQLNITSMAAVMREHYMPIMKAQFEEKHWLYRELEKRPPSPGGRKLEIPLRTHWGKED